MVQTLVPSDVAANTPTGSWTDDAGSPDSADLLAALEAIGSANDSTFITASNSGDFIRLRCNGLDPVVNHGHYIRVRARRTSGGAGTTYLRVSWRRGGTTTYIWQDQLLTTSFATYEFHMPYNRAALLRGQNHNTIQIRLEVIHTGGVGDAIEVSACEMEMPWPAVPAFRVQGFVWAVPTTPTGTVVLEGRTFDFFDLVLDGISGVPGPVDMARTMLHVRNSHGTCRAPTGGATPPVNNNVATAAIQLVADDRVRCYAAQVSPQEARTFSFELIEYRGPPGGDDEILVRGRGSKLLAGGTTSETIALATFTDRNKLAIMPTGFVQETATIDWSRCAMRYTFAATGGSGNPEWTFTVHTGTGPKTFWYEFVELGANWSDVQYVEHTTFTAAGTDETEACTDVVDWGNVVILNPGYQTDEDDRTRDTAAMVRPGANTTTLRFRLPTGGTTANKAMTACLIQHPLLIVAHDDSVTGTEFDIPLTPALQPRTYTVQNTFNGINHAQRVGLFMQANTTTSTAAIPGGVWNYSFSGGGDVAMVTPYGAVSGPITLDIVTWPQGEILLDSGVAYANGGGDMTVEVDVGTSLGTSATANCSGGSASMRVLQDGYPNVGVNPTWRVYIDPATGAQRVDQLQASDGSVIATFAQSVVTGQNLNPNNAPALVDAGIRAGLKAQLDGTVGEPIHIAVAPGYWCRYVEFCGTIGGHGNARRLVWWTNPTVRDQHIAVRNLHFIGEETGPWVPPQGGRPGSGRWRIDNTTSQGFGAFKWSSRAVTSAGNRFPTGGGIHDDIRFQHGEVFNHWVLNTQPNQNSGSAEHVMWAPLFPDDPRPFGLLRFYDFNFLAEPNSYSGANTQGQGSHDSKSAVRFIHARWDMRDVVLCNGLEHCLYLDAVQGDSIIKSATNLVTPQANSPGSGRTFMQVAGRADSRQITGGFGGGPWGKGELLLEDVTAIGCSSGAGGANFSFFGHLGTITLRRVRGVNTHGGLILVDVDKGKGVWTARDALEDPIAYSLPNDPPGFFNAWDPVTMTLSVPSVPGWGPLTNDRAQTWTTLALRIEDFQAVTTTGSTPGSINQRTMIVINGTKRVEIDQVPQISYSPGFPHRPQIWFFERNGQVGAPLNPNARPFDNQTVSFFCVTPNVAGDPRWAPGVEKARYNIQGLTGSPPGNPTISDAQLNLLEDINTAYPPWGTTAVVVTIPSPGATAEAQGGSQGMSVQFPDTPTTDLTTAARATADGGSQGMNVEILDTTEDFTVERAQIDFGIGADVFTYNVNGTIGNLDRAFARIAATHQSSGGPATLDVGDPLRNNADLGCVALVTSTSQVTLTRSSVGRNENCRVPLEIVQYTGATGGPNEWKVRYHDAIAFREGETIATIDASTAPGLANVQDWSRVVVFPCGVYTDADTREWGLCNVRFSVQASIEMIAIDRGDGFGPNGVGDVQVALAVVELTGSNWSSVKVTSGVVPFTGVTVRAHANVGDWARTLIIQSQISAGSGIDSINPVVFPGDTTDTIRIYRGPSSSGTVAVGTQAITNQAMEVEHIRSDAFPGGTYPALSGGGGGGLSATLTPFPATDAEPPRVSVFATTAPINNSSTNYPLSWWSWRYFAIGAVRYRTPYTAGLDSEWSLQLVRWPTPNFDPDLGAPATAMASGGGNILPYVEYTVDLTPAARARGGATFPMVPGVELQVPMDPAARALCNGGGEMVTSAPITVALGVAAQALAFAGGEFDFGLQANLGTPATALADGGGEMSGFEGSDMFNPDAGDQTLMQGNSGGVVWAQGWFGAPVNASPAPVPPGKNFVIVLIDDVGCDLIPLYDDVNGYGASDPFPYPNMPNLTAFAAQGVRFRQFRTNPVCSPTRASLMSGNYPFRHGMGSNSGNFVPGVFLEFNTSPSPVQTILHQALRQGGFGATATIGKWHLGQEPSDGGTMDTHPDDCGAGDFQGLPSNPGALPAPPEDNFPNGYENFWWIENGVRTQVEGLWLTSYNRLRAAQWWNLHEGDGARFLYLPFNAPHNPVELSWPPVGAGATPEHGFSTTPPPSTWTNMRVRAYLEQWDYQFGRLLEEIDFDTTVVMVLGDNGTAKPAVLDPSSTNETAYPVGHPLAPSGDFRTLASIYSASLYTGSHFKNTIFEQGINVPMIVRGPASDVTPGLVVDDLVDVVDIYATVCELAGVAVPPGAALDSISFAPVLKGQPGARTVSHTETYRPNGPGGVKDIDQKAVVMDIGGARYKLLYRIHNGVRFLFNLTTDPFERTPLDHTGAFSSQYQTLLDELNAKYGLSLT